MICQTSRTGTIAERHREDHTDAPKVERLAEVTMFE